MKEKQGKRKKTVKRKKERRNIFRKYGKEKINKMREIKKIRNISTNKFNLKSL